MKKKIELIESQQKIDFDTYIDELRTQLKKEQIVSISMGVTPPSRQEVEAWYRKNKTKLGYEVHVKHILIRPKSRNLADERAANNQDSLQLTWK